MGEELLNKFKNEFSVDALTYLEFPKYSFWLKANMIVLGLFILLSPPLIAWAKNIPFFHSFCFLALIYVVILGSLIFLFLKITGERNKKISRLLEKKLNITLTNNLWNVKELRIYQCQLVTRHLIINGF